MTETTDTKYTIARLRRTLLLLANNQSEQQQRAAAGRHLAALGRAMRDEERVKRTRQTERREGREEDR